MGFISFHENYYRNRLEAFESRTLSEEDIYEVNLPAQMLRTMDGASKTPAVSQTFV